MIERKENPFKKSWTRSRMAEGFWHKVAAWFFAPRFDRIRIEESVVQDICALARGAHPKETIAFLTGSIHKEGKGKERGRVLVIDGLYLKAYDASEYSTSFTTHDLPADNVYGTVHSHPGFSNRPSAADKRLFQRYGWFHAIICQPYTEQSIRYYNKYGEPIEL